MDPHVVRIMGEAHGDVERYIKLANQCSYSVLSGEIMCGSKPTIYDMQPLKDAYADKRINPNCHLILPGNHDNYDVIGDIPSFLVNPGYGMFDVGPLASIASFYVRGAASIDKAMRTEGRSWWRKEELTIRALHDAMEFYTYIKPDVMITHTCPDIVVPGLLDPGQRKLPFRTEQALQAMLEAHQPRVWIFGHFHKTKRINLPQFGTEFIALGELSTCDLNVSDFTSEVNGTDGFNWLGGY